MPQNSAALPIWEATPTDSGTDMMMHRVMWGLMQWQELRVALALFGCDYQGIVAPGRQVEPGCAHQTRSEEARL